MKIEQIKKLLNYMPADSITWVFRKEPSVYGVGLHAAVCEFVRNHGMEFVQVNLSRCDDFFMHELRELIAFREGEPFVCMFDFTDGCGKELKNHLYQLLINRHHNEFDIPENMKVVIYDNKVEPDEYDMDKFDIARLDKCQFYNVED